MLPLLQTPAADALLAEIRFDAQGLVPVIAQDHNTGVVRMFAYANAQALRNTAATGLATFWSRSRNELWQKGLTSGHSLAVSQIRIDCDGDAILYVCAADGPSCHTGRTSCFFRHAHGQNDPPNLTVDDGPAEIPATILNHLAAVIAARRQEPPDKSYVSSLLTRGVPKINSKITEEAREITEALLTPDKSHIAHEAADLLFHVLVGLEATGVPLSDVFGEFQRRFGVGGHDEKASRKGS